MKEKGKKTTTEDKNLNNLPSLYELKLFDNFQILSEAIKIRIQGSLPSNMKIVHLTGL